jgi:DNA invertase Pin-like site-specific DNA recombinase
VAYCRVSTLIGAQADGLEHQREFFESYAQRHGFDLLCIYADEGKSGTKLRVRPQFLRMMEDARSGAFDTVLVKDVSRLARNTIDFLQSIRELKDIGVKVVFVNSDLTSQDSSEFTLTLLAAIAQEESQNTSKRVKFGYKISAAKGKVPTIVYGYNHIRGQAYSLEINEQEAAVVRDIFDWYLCGMGPAMIAKELAARGKKTKLGGEWRAKQINDILRNEIYIGRISNGKQEVKNFLTSERENKPRSEWVVVERTEMEIIEKGRFFAAQKRLEERSVKTLGTSNTRRTSGHIFSKLIVCAACGHHFIIRKEKNGTEYWTCWAHNRNRDAGCQNRAYIRQEVLLEAIGAFFQQVSANKEKFIEDALRDRMEETDALAEKATTRAALVQKKEKQMKMFERDIITLEELHLRVAPINEMLAAIDREEILQSGKTKSGESVKKNLAKVFALIESLRTETDITNHLLSQIFDRIEIDAQKNISFYLQKGNL